MLSDKEYYQRQIEYAAATKDNAGQIKLIGSNKSNWLSLNLVSAQVLVDWLTTNFLTPAENTTDLFENTHLLPKEVRKIIQSYEELEFNYERCEQMLQELKPHNYTFEYGLDGIPFNLKELQ